jgi:hypothetical protein
MADNIAFYNPTDFGCWDLGTTQIDKSLVFSWDHDVIQACKVVIFERDTIVKQYAEGQGLTRSNDDRTVTLLLQGDDFKTRPGQKLTAHCTFFNERDTEVTFSLKIIKTFL